MGRLIEVTNLTPICRRPHSHRTAGIVTGISNMLPNYFWCKNLQYFCIIILCVYVCVCAMLGAPNIVPRMN